MGQSMIDQKKHYATVAQAIAYIGDNVQMQPSLAEISAFVGLSEHHLQRIFSQWAGISPKRFLQYLTKEYAKSALLESSDVLSASIDAGLSGPGRLHDLMVTCEAMTPGEIKTKGSGISLSYGFSDSPFGKALLGWTSRGICKLVFCEGETGEMLQALAEEWPAARLLRDDTQAEKLCEQIFHAKPGAGKLHLLLRGTNFQIKVWEALLNIGSSQIVSYSALANLAGSPKAQRAVGTALAANDIAYLIPCHRVIRESGDVGIYRWGSDRKKAMLAWEAARYKE